MTEPKPGTKLRQALVDTARAMNRQGLNQGRSGNVSARHGEGMLITASGCHFDDISAEHIVETDFAGNTTDSLNPSSEWGFHTALYEQRPDARAVVHVHSPWATSLACLNRDIPSFHYMVAVAGGMNIPCVPYATFGTQELAHNIKAGVAERDACLIANHGQLALADSLPAALELAAEVELLARCYMQALSVSEPVLLTTEQMQEVLDKFHGYRRNAESSDARATN